MESAYILAGKELERIRFENAEKLNERRKEVLAKTPEIGKIEDQLMKEGSRLLSCVLNRCDDFEDIKKNIQGLQSKKAKTLLDCGFSEDYLDELYSCAQCRDTGFVEGRRCSCLKNLISKYIGANSNLTEYMRSHTFENFDVSLFARQDEKTLKIMQKICDMAIEFAENFDQTRENFLIMGNAGTGKTFITSCVANRALERGKTVYYQTAYKLFEFFEEAKFGKENEDAAEVVKYVYDVDLLIIDDLGTEFSTHFTLATFFDIINSRITSGKSTIISSNLGFEELSNIYSQRITSRFMGSYTLTQTIGRDLRGLIREINKK